MSRSSRRSLPPLTTAWRLVVVTAAVWCLAGCRVPLTPDHPPQVLSAETGRGASAVDAPRGWHGDYWATFGAFLLCTRTAGEVPVLQRVDFLDGDAKPVAARAVLRVVSPQYVRAHPHLPVDDLALMGFDLGSPPRFSESYAGPSAPGDYSHPIRGFRVATTCPQAWAIGSRPGEGRIPRWTQVELMVAVKSRPSGSVVKGIDIRYSVAGHSMSLPVRWELVNCGPAVASHC